MDSKILFAFVLFINICIITVTAKVHTYGVIVRTANKDFESHAGKLKLSVMRNYTSKVAQEDFVLTPNDVEIKKDHKYTAIISSIARSKKIASVYLQWILAEPYNPYYAIKKPTIYFHSVILSRFTSKHYPEDSECESLIFKPETIPIGIEHADGARFDLRDTEFLWKIHDENSNVSVAEAECFT